MSFADLLRQSRSTPTAVFHQFLTNYDPSEPRVYAFVEGDADRAFYRAFIDRFLGERRLFIYNCEGKANVFEAYTRVTQRHPHCRNVFFFVDKDVDELVGKNWQADPRIFTTEVYSVENYLTNFGAVDRYLADFVKLRRVSLDIERVTTLFASQLGDFHQTIRPLMCWIIAARRSGESVVLSSLKLEKLFSYDGTRIKRIRRGSPLEYLYKVTQTTASPQLWRQARRVCRELGQRDPKQYVRGKFEAWFLLEFVKRVISDLAKVADEAGGGVSVSTPLHDSNFVQVLVRGTEIPSSLNSFLRFHLTSIPTAREPETGALLQRVMKFFFKFLPRV